jgi:hypothetical protein
MIETVIIQALSLVGVAMVVGLAWLMGFRQRARINDESHLLALAATAEKSLPVHVLLDGEGRSGLVVLADSRLILVKALGDRMSVRAIAQAGLRDIAMYRPTRRFALGLRIKTKDLGFPDLVLEVREKEPPAWLDRLRREVG